MYTLSGVRPPLFFLLCSLLALSAAACGSSGSTEASDRSSSLEANRKKWEGAGIAHYQFVFNWSCFCITDYVRPVRITVRGGKIEQITYADDGQAVPADRYEDYRTIDQLFDFLDEPRARSAARLDAEYNPKYGYPLNAYVDYDERMADEEKGFLITEFDVIP